MLRKSVIFQLSGVKFKQQRHHARFVTRSLCGLLIYPELHSKSLIKRRLLICSPGHHFLVAPRALMVV